MLISEKIMMCVIAVAVGHFVNRVCHILGAEGAEKRQILKCNMANHHAYLKKLYSKESFNKILVCLVVFLHICKISFFF